MNILIENGSYRMRNLGDIAMLQVAVRRLRSLWPSASIHVLTDAEERLHTLCPGVQSISGRGGRMWYRRQRPRCAALAAAPRLQAFLREKWDCTIHGRESSEFTRGLGDADLVVTAGGGYINDVFKEQAIRVLTILETSVRSGKATAMLGQGIGPLRSPDLLARGAAVLPHMRLIAIREERIGRSTLESLGVPSDKIIATGDDAVEPAYDMRPSKLGTAIGVNLRVASYSVTQPGHIRVIRFVLHELGTKYNVPFVPLPVLSDCKNSDGEVIRHVLPVASHLISGAQVLDDPAMLIRRIGGCRIVVTGSYHAAVLALAQGVSAIGLVNSAYYDSKFHGLKDQFGGGCQVVTLDDKDLRERLVDAVDAAYTSAADVRPHLLEAATRQISAGQHAYRRLHALIESRA